MKVGLANDWCSCASWDTKVHTAWKDKGLPQACGRNHTLLQGRPGRDSQLLGISTAEQKGRRSSRKRKQTLGTETTCALGVAPVLGCNSRMHGEVAWAEHSITALCKVEAVPSWLTLLLNWLLCHGGLQFKPGAKIHLQVASDRAFFQSNKKSN